MRQAARWGSVGPRGKRLGSHLVETNARALIEVLRGIPQDRHVCVEARDGGVQGPGPVQTVGSVGAGTQLRRAGRGPGKEPAEERVSLAGRMAWQGALGLREGRAGRVAGEAAGSEPGVGRGALRGARCARSAEREGGEGALGRGPQASGMAHGGMGVFRRPAAGQPVGPVLASGSLAPYIESFAVPPASHGDPAR
jgi:hypothetical protein